MAKSFLHINSDKYNYALEFGIGEYKTQKPKSIRLTVVKFYSDDKAIHLMTLFDYDYSNELLAFFAEVYLELSKNNFDFEKHFKTDENETGEKLEINVLVEDELTSIIISRINCLKGAWLTDINDMVMKRYDKLSRIDRFDIPIESTMTMPVQSFIDAVNHELLEKKLEIRTDYILEFDSESFCYDLPSLMYLLETIEEPEKGSILDE